VGIASSIFPLRPAPGQSGHHRPAQRHARGLLLGTVRPGGRPNAAGSARYGTTATSVSPAGPVLASHATSRRTQPARSQSSFPAWTWPPTARRRESPRQRSWSRWPALTAASAGRLRQRSPRPTARRALARHRGTARRWDGTGPVLNAASPDELTEQLEAEAAKW